MRPLLSALEPEIGFCLHNDPIGNPSILFDHLPILATIIDMQSHEILYANRHTQTTFGGVVGKICWQEFHRNQQGPCPFCNDAQLIDKDGFPTGSFRRQTKNTLTQRWFDTIESAAIAKDGRMVKMSIAMDITDQRKSREPCPPDSPSEDPSSCGVPVMCAHCHKIRGQDGKWETPAHYLKEKLGLLFSHGICCSCGQMLYSEFEIGETREGR